MILDSRDSIRFNPTSKQPHGERIIIKVTTGEREREKGREKERGRTRKELKVTSWKEQLEEWRLGLLWERNRKKVDDKRVREKKIDDKRERVKGERERKQRVDEREEVVEVLSLSTRLRSTCLESFATLCFVTLVLKSVSQRRSWIKQKKGTERTSTNESTRYLIHQPHACAIRTALKI